MNAQQIGLGILRIILAVSAAAMLSACGQPTKEELLDTQRAKKQHCQELQQRIENASDLLQRATLQENFNHQCLDRHYPEQVQ